MTPAKRPAAPPSALGDFLRILWQAPLVAVPFAVFFIFVRNAPFSSFLSHWIVALVFASVVNAGVWSVTHVIMPRFPALHDDKRVWHVAALYTGVSLLCSFLASLILHFTLIPGFLGGVRAVVTLSMFALLFAILFAGLSLAFQFYQSSMARAGSERELQLARRIQESFLLSEFPQRPRLEVHAVNVSSKQVSGDFYDVVPVGEDGFLLAIADVSGKGVPAALLSSMLQASLRTQAGTVSSVAEMMKSINRLVCQRAVTGQFATFFLAAIDEREMAIRFTNAGHNFPVLFRRDGSRKTLETGGIVVGMLEDATFTEERTSLAPGDRIVFYTDGVTEAENAAGEMFGEERFMALVEALPAGLDARGIVDGVLAGLRRWLGEIEAGDDVTVMALRVRDSPQQR